MGKDLKGKELGEGLCQIKDGRYLARYTDYYGKRKTIYGHKLKEVKEKLTKAKYEDNLYQGRVDGSKLTLDELYKLWIKYKEKTTKGSTVFNYVNIYNILKNTFGFQKISTISRVDIEKFLYEIQSKYKDGTIIVVKNLIHDMMKFAVRNNYIMYNVCDNVEYKRRNEKKVEKYLSQEQIEAFLLYCDKHQAKITPILKLLLYTGLRVGELCALTWSDINFNERNIYINKTYALNSHYNEDRKGLDNKSYNQSPKSKSSNRIVPMCDIVYNILKEQKESKYTTDTFVFITTHKIPYNDVSIDCTLKSTINRYNKNNNINIPMFSAHWLRHTFATMCIEKDIQPKIIQTYLGHTDIQTTMNIYTHVPKELLKQEINKLDNFD